ncbi:MAG: glycosyltransferase [Ignavibacteria bacterium]|nr:glycosyltransferase [Ignavibacteria bacterium]
MKKNLKVFCGYTNTAANAYIIAEGLRKNNIKADSVVIDDHTFAYPYHKKIKFLNSKHKFINRLLKYFYFIKHALLYDVFIFNTRNTFLAKKGDLKILKMMGKKTGMIYVGCDIRDKNLNLTSPDKYTICKNCSDEYQKKIRCYMEEKIKETEIIQKYISASFAHPFDATILKGKIHYFYTSRELDKYKPQYRLNERIKIVHAPSDDGIKGTKYVIKAIETLKREGCEFDFELIRNKSNDETLEAIRNSDILIDQMVLGYYGLVSVEGMALGKTVVCYIKEKLYDYLPDLPIINLNPDNLAEGLKELIQNREKLTETGKLGREFAEKYHDYRKNSLNMLKIILNET